MKLIFACVRTGTRYGPEYVERLRNGIARHVPSGVPYTITCVTDQPEKIEGVNNLLPPDGLVSWWAKLSLFSVPWRINARVIALDLDTVVVGDLARLIAVPSPFAICENFARLNGSKTWPCKYGSCVMVINPECGGSIWAKARSLMADADWMSRFRPYGDQRVLEECEPEAVLLQRVLPPPFFVNYRRLGTAPPHGAALVIFGGKNKPHNCSVPWVKEQWV